MDKHDRGQMGEVALLLLLAAIGLIPVVGALVAPGWSQVEVALGMLLAGFAGLQLVRGLWAWCWGTPARGQDQPPRSRSL